MSSLEREVHPYLTTHSDETSAELLWSPGPKAGEVYSTVAAPDQADLADLPTMDEVQDNILEGLAILDEHEGSPYQRPPAYVLARAALYEYTHNLYYGLQSRVGLRDAQLFDARGQGESYNYFLNTVDRVGLREYLQSLAENHGLQNVVIGKGSFESSAEDYALYERLFSAGVVDDAEEKQRHLVHYTLSNTVPAVVELGCLASDVYRKSMGITKESGESKRGSADFVDEHEVCFWPRRITVNGSNLDCTYGKTSFNIGFEYPVAWGINIHNGTDLPVVDGAWSGEKAIANKVDLSDVTNLWVAPFDVARHAEILRRHGFGHVAVRPFINPLSQSRYREVW